MKSADNTFDKHRSAAASDAPFASAMMFLYVLPLTAFSNLAAKSKQRRLRVTIL